MTDTPIRLAGLRGTLASFAVDLFAGRVGSVTDAPLCSGVFDRWGIYDGSAWRLGPASDYAGNSHMLSLAINNNTFVDSARNVSANEVRTGGLLRINSLGDGTLRNLALTGWLTINGATRPAWGANLAQSLQTSQGTALGIYADASGDALELWSNLYFDGSAFKAQNAKTDSLPARFAIGNGFMSFMTSTVQPIAGGAVSDMLPRFQVNRFGGLGAFGVTPPTARPTISGQRTATATLASLYAALSATGLILDSTTGSSVQREAIIQPLPITNAAPGTVTIAGGVKSFGFDGGASTEELFYHCDVQHDYIAGGDQIFHIHWLPDTGAGGNVKWQIEYMWVEGGGVWNAASTLSTTTSAGTTAKADLRTDIVIAGAGHTYNSRIVIRLFRNPADAADTYAGDAILSSVGMHYQSDPGQP